MLRLFLSIPKSSVSAVSKKMSQQEDEDHDQATVGDDGMFVLCSVVVCVCVDELVLCCCVGNGLLLLQSFLKSVTQMFARNSTSITNYTTATTAQHTNTYFFLTHKKVQRFKSSPDFAIFCCSLLFLYGDDFYRVFDYLRFGVDLFCFCSKLRR